MRAIVPKYQSAEYDKRVVNISLFVYIGSPGLHRNSRQAPGSSRHSAITNRRLACIIILPLRMCLSGRSLAWDHFRGDIDDPCGAIADFCGVIADPCCVVALPEAIGGPRGRRWDDADRFATH